MITIPINLTLHLLLETDETPIDQTAIFKAVNTAIFEALVQSDELTDLISDQTGWLVSSYTLEGGQ